MGFRLTSEPITGPLLDGRPEAGAIATFEGIVRDNNEGSLVESLEYEAFDELASSEGESVVSEALERFQILEAECVHRVGHLKIGEAAIRVEVCAGHRQEAFAACRWIVDEVKRRVPIWKKEHYASGATEWLNPLESVSSRKAEQAYYGRQMRLSEVGEEGQAKLKAARVLVVGAGGLGCAVLPYLAAAGVGHTGICDGDRVDLSNLHRQVLFGVGDVGRSKAQVASERLNAQNTYVATAVHDVRLTAQDAHEIADGYDVIVDCTDNLSTKRLLNRVAAELGIPLVTSAIYRYEGQLQVVVPGGPCLACGWPVAPPEGCVRDCADVGVLGAVPGVFGCLQVTEVLKLVLGLPSPLRAGKLLLFDLLSMESTLIGLTKRADCPVCGAGEAAEVEELELVPQDLSAYRVIDIRERCEVRAEPLPWAQGELAPTSEWEDSMIDGRPTLLVCAHGIRSFALAAHLRRVGRPAVYSLPGGVATLRGIASRKASGPR